MDPFKKLEAMRVVVMQIERSKYPEVSRAMDICLNSLKKYVSGI